MPAESALGSSRYLLYDPTAGHTALGFLPSPLLGSHVMMCTPDGAQWVQISESQIEETHIRFALEPVPPDERKAWRDARRKYQRFWLYDTLFLIDNKTRLVKKQQED